MQNESSSYTRWHGSFKAVLSETVLLLRQDVTGPEITGKLCLCDLYVVFFKVITI